MLEIFSLVLVLQIGFNAARNYHGEKQNLLFPSSLSINHGQARRFDSNSYQPPTFRRFSVSDSDQSDSEDSSLEESGYRSLRPSGRPYQRRNNLRYNSRFDNDVSLETTPVDRLRSDIYQSYISPSRRADKNFRRPYLRHRPNNLRHNVNRRHHRRGDRYNDISLEVSPIDENNALVTLRGSREEDTSYLRSLLSTSDRMDMDEDEVESVQTYRRESSGEPQSRQAYDNILKALSDRRDIGDDNTKSSSLRSPHSNYRKKNRRARKMNTEFRPRKSSTKEKDAYIDTVVFLSDEGKPVEASIARSQLPNEASNLIKIKSKPMKHNTLNIYDNKHLRNHPIEYYKNDDGSVDLESLFGDDSSESLLVSSIEDPALLRNRYQNNRKKYERNFLRLAVSPNDGLTLDEDLASRLSAILDENLGELNIAPATNLRSSARSYQRHNRRNGHSKMLKLSSDNKQSAEEDIPSNLSVLHLGSLGNSNAQSVLLRNHQSKNRNNNLRSSRKDDKKKGIELVLRDKLEDNAAVDLVPYHERRSSEPTRDVNINNKNNYRKNNEDLNDEFNIDSLFNHRKDDVSNGDKLSASGTIGLDDDITDNLHLEYPWDGQLSPDDDDESSNHSGFRGVKSKLRSPEHTDNHRNKDTKNYELTLEYPWNGEPSPKQDTSNLSKSRLRSDKKSENNQNNDSKKYELTLEYPWNGEPSPKQDNLSKSQLRSDKNSKNNQNNDSKKYELNLEYPWNGQRSINGTKKSNILESKVRSHEPSDSENIKKSELKVEYPWIGDLNPGEDKESSDESVVRKLKSRLKSRVYPEDSRRNKLKRKIGSKFKKNGKPDDKNSTKKSPLRAARVPDPSYKHPYLRSLQKSGRKTNSQSFNGKERLMENRARIQADTKSYRRKSDRSLNDDKNLPVHSITRRGRHSDDSFYLSDDTSPYITSSLDRRPHPRLRSQDEIIFLDD